MHFPHVGEIRVLDENARANAPNAFIRLSAGQTHYAISGPHEGRFVVLIHGIAGPMGIWGALAHSLVINGFRVLYYDLFGRGFSDRPVSTYDIDLFVTQLRDLLSELSLPVPFTLVGWSLGGMISVSYAARYPGEVDQLVLIAPAGIEVSLPTISKIGMLPVLGDIIMSVLGRRIVLRSVINGLYRKDLEGVFLSLVSDQMRYRGYLRAFLSTMRSCGKKDVSETYRKAGSDNLPVLLISGTEDPSIPSSVHTRLRELIPNLKHHEIEKSGHFPHYERREEVAARIIEFLHSEVKYSG